MPGLGGFLRYGHDGGDQEHDLDGYARQEQDVPDHALPVVEEDGEREVYWSAFEGARGDTTATRLLAREVGAVDEGDTSAGSSEVVGGCTAGWAGADDSNVVFGHRG